jgi:probable rRNA maturation factor
MPVALSTRHLRSLPMKRAVLEERARRMLRALERESAELSIVLCDDVTIRELNRDYRERDAPTDVLAFPMGEGEGGDLQPDLLGDVVISVDTARRQQKRPTLHEELTFLLAHGLLHLLGYDHATRAEERRMSARTDILMAAAMAR